MLWVLGNSIGMVLTEFWIPSSAEEPSQAVQSSLLRARPHGQCMCTASRQSLCPLFERHMPAYEWTGSAVYSAHAFGAGNKVAVCVGASAVGGMENPACHP